MTGVQTGHQRAVVNSMLLEVPTDRCGRCIARREGTTAVRRKVVLESWKGRKGKGRGDLS